MLGIPSLKTILFNIVAEYYLCRQEPDVSPHHKIPLLNSAQPELYFDLRVTKPGRHVVLVNYVTPPDQRGSARVEVSARTQTEQEKG